MDWSCLVLLVMQSILHILYFMMFFQLESKGLSDHLFYGFVYLDIKHPVLTFQYLIIYTFTFSNAAIRKIDTPILSSASEFMALRYVPYEFARYIYCYITSSGIYTYCTLNLAEPLYPRLPTMDISKNMVYGSTTKMKLHGLWSTNSIFWQQSQKEPAVHSAVHHLLSPVQMFSIILRHCTCDNILVQNKLLFKYGCRA